MSVTRSYLFCIWGLTRSRHYSPKQRMCLCSSTRTACTYAITYTCTSIVYAILHVEDCVGLLKCQRPPVYAFSAAARFSIVRKMHVCQLSACLNIQHHSFLVVYEHSAVDPV